MDNYYLKYKKYKMKYLTLKNQLDTMVGGAGVPIRITNGVDSFTLSGYNQIIQLHLKLEEMHFSWKRISKMLYDFATKISDYNLNKVISVSKKQYITLKKISDEYL